MASEGTWGAAKHIEGFSRELIDRLRASAFFLVRGAALVSVFDLPAHGMEEHHHFDFMVFEG